MSGNHQVPWKHVVMFISVVFICSFLFAYQYIETSNYCISPSQSRQIFTPQPIESISVSRSSKVSLQPQSELPSASFQASEKGSTSIHGESHPCCLPNTLIIGAKKAGTRALINFLKMHPEVRAAPNEVHFFDRDENYSLGINWYARQMSIDAPSKVIIEKSPYYFVDWVTPKRVLQYNSTIHLILLVRNPVNRVLSDQTQLMHNSGGQTLDLGEKIFASSDEINVDAKILQPSLYAKHLSHWLQYFPRQQFHIVDGDKLIDENPYYEMERLETFLQLPKFYSIDSFLFNKTKGFYCPVLRSGKIKCLGSTKGHKHVDFDKTLIERLTEFFQPYNEQFYTLVGHSFDWT